MGCSPLRWRVDLPLLHSRSQSDRQTVQFCLTIPIALLYTHYHPDLRPATAEYTMLYTHVIAFASQYFLASHAPNSKPVLAIERVIWSQQ